MKRIDNNKGFTIIELLIATITFAVVLLVITSAIVQIGRIYYKGVVQSRTQERARAITDSVAKNLQFSNVTSFRSNPGYLCIGDYSYVYALETQVDDAQHGLLLTTNKCSNSTTNGVEMLGERMQLVKLDVTPIAGQPGSYTIHVRVVYGADEDFEKKHSTDATGDPEMPCKPIVLGGQFCAVSELTTTVVSRLR